MPILTSTITIIITHSKVPPPPPPILLTPPLVLLTLMEHHCTGKVMMECSMKTTTRLKGTQIIKDLFLPRNKTLEGSLLPVFLASGFPEREEAGTWILTNLMLLKTTMRKKK